MASVYVRGFPKRTGQRDLEKFFSEIGSVNEVRMVRDFAFIVFKDKDKARDAVGKINGSNFDGQILTVQLSKERSGPQANDICRSCGRRGHWQTHCPENRNRKRGRSSSRSSSSRSSESKLKQRRKKNKKSNAKSLQYKKKHSKRKYKRSESSNSSSSSSSSRSRSASSESSRSADKKKRR